MAKRRGGSDAALAPDVLHAACGLDDERLAATWAAPLSLAHVAVPDALAALVERYGADWLEARFEVWGVRELVQAAARADLREWAIDVVREARSEMTASELEHAQLVIAVDALRDALDIALAVPPRDGDDRSINVELACDCELCDELNDFLSSRSARALDWPIAKHRRQHVHRKLEQHDLPVAHTTRRQGRPYTLMLRKTDKLFVRQEQARQRMQEGLAWLSESSA